jgi:hypothetical protein
MKTYGSPKETREEIIQRIKENTLKQTQQLKSTLPFLTTSIQKF